MKPLLETDSPLYLKRLVRALNSEARTGNGFYAPTPSSSERCTAVRMANSKRKAAVVLVRLEDFFQPSVTVD